MRKVGLVVLTALLASLGLLACVPVAPVAPGATPAWTPEVWTPPPATPTVAPPLGEEPLSRVTKNFLVGYAKDPLPLQAGDIVVVSVRNVGEGVTVSVDGPSLEVVLAPKAIQAPADSPLGTPADGKFSFQAKVTGTHQLL